MDQNHHKQHSPLETMALLRPTRRSAAPCSGQKVGSKDAALLYISPATPEKGIQVSDEQ